MPPWQCCLSIRGLLPRHRWRHQRFGINSGHRWQCASRRRFPHEDPAPSRTMDHPDPIQIDASRSQMTFQNRHVYRCVFFVWNHKKKQNNNSWIIISSSKIFGASRWLKASCRASTDSASFWFGCASWAIAPWENQRIKSCGAFWSLDSSTVRNRWGPVGWY